MSNQAYTDKTITFFNCDDGSWENYSKTEDFLKFINPLDGMELSAAHTNVYVKPLPFYKDVDLLHVVTQGWEGDDVYYFFVEDNNTGDYVLLQGASDVIHELNGTGVLNLNSENVMDYLKFFCQFTKDDEGECFYIVENEKSETIDGLSQYDHSRYLRRFDGTKVAEEAALDKYKIETRVFHTGHVYDAEFEIQNDGYVEMIKDEMVGSV